PLELPDRGQRGVGRFDRPHTSHPAVRSMPGKMSRGVVIVGAGQAGFQTAVSLRAEGYEEPITIIGDEPHLPYQRPPLSKGFMTGGQEIEATELRPATFYSDKRIRL